MQSLFDFFDFFISKAHAEAAAGAQASPSGGGFSLSIMMLVFVVFAYFFILRPQTKRAKETQTLLNSLNKGDEVVTAGGLLGRITKLTDQYVAVAIADGVEIMVQKSSIVGLLPKGTIKSIQ